MALLKSIINLILKFNIQSPKGAFYERKACRYLKRQGLRYIAKNFRCYVGEIDLIMQEGEAFIFVEVRYRKNSLRQSSLESIDFYKQKRLRKTADFYLQVTHCSEKPCRFDVVGFDDKQLSWIKDAF